MTAPLAKFMKKLNGLPDSVRSTYDEIIDLDRSCVDKRKELSKICVNLLKQQQGSKKPAGKKEPKKRSYSEAMKLLNEMQEMSTSKLQLASECYEQVDRYIIELDKAYGKFAQNIGNSSQADKKQSHKIGSVGRKKKSRHDVDTDATGDSIEFENPLVEMPVDPNEPTYCICHQVSFGNMVCCDNKTCPIEWFHFNCVGLTSTPKGKWYCPDCKDKVGKRGRKSFSEKK